VERRRVRVQGRVLALAPAKVPARPAPVLAWAPRLGPAQARQPARVPRPVRALAVAQVPELALAQAQVPQRLLRPPASRRTSSKARTPSVQARAPQRVQARPARWAPACRGFRQAVFS
jgi:hypothetical protein